MAETGYIEIYKDGCLVQILVEPEAYEGVRKIGKRVAQDIELVTECRPDMVEKNTDIRENQVIVAATWGKSPLLKIWQDSGKLDSSFLAEKREVYFICIVPYPFRENPNVEKALVIAGSDKRGTIYGLFRLSELCGVSSLVFWGDVRPEKRQELILEIGEGIFSKEPSVRYRGFFINDEWPAFGNWCMERYGGINAKAYDEIFIFLLRMKGNYIWPAMWGSVFSEDGPGLASAELADRYGVIIGHSHHEPMCRAGAEWQKIYRKYGEDNTWNFTVNRNSITAFWREGILRNKPFENLITIGMRGENDSKLMPENVALQDNIQVLKDAILTQHRLICENIDQDLGKVPRMLAIYKEVEDYYYGDDTCQGLKDWEELEDVIFLLCDDNFGNTRGLPTEEDPVHPGGYGMYYHFDYHGGPVSYEWQNSTRLTKTWEQMTMAYEHGVRELWIVNAGDIKGVEYPLTYFMELAYDYEKWSPPNRTEIFVKEWIDQQFGGRMNQAQKEQLFILLEGWSRWSAARKPEAMNPEVYHPCHYREGDRVWDEVSALMALAEDLHSKMDADCQNAFESMVYYPAMATWNLILMHIEAGMNAHFAKRGSIRANTYGNRVKERIQMDAAYVESYHKMAGGKWNHMMDSAHSGFRTWDDKEWSYPVIQRVVPIREGKIAVGFRGDEAYHLGAHWQDGQPIYNEDFIRPDTKEVLIELDSRGCEDFSFYVKCDKPWLSFKPQNGKVSALEEGGKTISVICHREQLFGMETALVEIEIEFSGGNRTVGRLALTAGMDCDAAWQEECFLEQQGYVAMEAAHFNHKQDVGDDGFRTIKYLGRMGDAVRTFPMTKSWIGKREVPFLRYDFMAKEESVYAVELYLAPRNPRLQGGRLRCQIAVNEEPRQVVDVVSLPFRTEPGNLEWARSVLDNIRIAKAEVPVKGGLNHFYYYGGDPEIVLEKIILHKVGRKLPESYLGPQESWRVKGYSY